MVLKRCLKSSDGQGYGYPHGYAGTGQAGTGQGLSIFTLGEPAPLYTGQRV